MSGDKKRSTSSEIEYEYAGEDTGQQELSPESAQSSVSSFAAIKERLLEKLPKKKKTRAIIIVLVAIYIVYKFVSVGESTPPPSVSTQEKIISQPLTKPAVEAAPVKPVVTKSVTVTTPTASTKSLNYSPTQNEQDSQMKELQASLNQMNQSIATLESSLLSLTSSVIGLSNKVIALERMRQEEKTTTRKNPLAVYYLQSLVPERAWLQTPGGDLMTVKIGDSISSYGQIQEINVKAGTVSTSSGRVIHYGPNDS